MNDLDLLFYEVQKFLIEEKNLLQDDRNTIDFLVNVLQDEQQKTSLDFCNQSIRDEIIEGTCQENASFSNDGKEELCLSLRNQADSFSARINTNFQKRNREYNSQEEKERLACLFENSPNYFNKPAIPKAYYDVVSKDCDWNRKNISRNIDVDKENRDPENNNESPSLHMAISFPPHTGRSRTMVRFGEYSPLNPEISCLKKKSLSMFGEYEERRRLFLEKKKQEYLEYLKNAKKNKNNYSNNKDLPMYHTFRTNAVDPSDINVSDNLSSTTYRNDHSTEKKTENLDFDSCYARLQQNNYRRELDRQVQEKERLKKEREDKERHLCEKVNFEDSRQRQKIMEKIEDQYQSRINVLTKCRNEAVKANPELFNVEIRSQTGNEERPEDSVHNKVLPANTQNHISRIPSLMKSNNKIEKYNKLPQTGNVNSENTKIPEYLQNPLMKQSAESCAINDIEAFRKMKTELYKKELEKQILEKRRLEEERKRKAREEEEKLNRKVQIEAEKLREEFEREEAKRVYCAAQKSQLQKLVHDQIHKLNFESVNTTPIKTSKIPLKAGKSLNNPNWNSSTHTKPFKNVTFAAEVLNKNSTKNTTSLNFHEPNRRRCNEDQATIIEAPYELATTSGSNEVNKCSTVYQALECLNADPTSQPLFIAEKQFKRKCSEEPVDNLCSAIPPSVSMSKKATQQFFKSNTFTDLSRIRKMLKKQQI